MRVDAGGGTQRATSSSGFVLVAFGVLLWGTGGVAGAMIAANSQMSLLAVAALRLLVGGLLMLAVTAASGQLRRIPRTRASVRHIVLSGLLVAVYGGAYFQAVAHIGVAVATVLSLGVAPLVVAVYTAVRTRRLPGARVVVALVAALGGLYLVSDVPAPGAGEDSLWWGIALAVLAGVAFAAITVVNRRVVPGLAPAPLIATAFTFAGLVSLTWAVPAGVSLGTLNALAWWALAFLAVVQTAIGYLAFYAGLQRGITATAAAVLSLIEPVAATVLAVLLLGEQLTPAAITGMVLLLTAVMLARDRGSGP